MPWCENCDRFYNPNSVAPDGTCVKCGAQIGDPPDVPSRAPWHFKLLIAAVVIYLGWRLVQGIAWVIGHL